MSKYVWGGRSLRCVCLRGNTEYTEWMWTSLETNCVFISFCCVHFALSRAFYSMNRWALFVITSLRFAIVNRNQPLGEQNNFGCRFSGEIIIMNSFKWQTYDRDLVWLLLGSMLQLVSLKLSIICAIASQAKRTVWEANNNLTADIGWNIEVMFIANHTHSRCTSSILRSLWSANPFQMCVYVYLCSHRNRNRK